MLVFPTNMFLGAQEMAGLFLCLYFPFQYNDKNIASTY
jgi:hypothetical protein